MLNNLPCVSACQSIAFYFLKRTIRGSLISPQLIRRNIITARAFRRKNFHSNLGAVKRNTFRLPRLLRDRSGVEVTGLGEVTIAVKVSGSVNVAVDQSLLD